MTGPARMTKNVAMTTRISVHRDGFERNDIYELGTEGPSSNTDRKLAMTAGSIGGDI
jgi:hypothetical protein